MKELSRDEKPTNSNIKAETLQYVEAPTSSSGITPSSSSGHIKSYFIGMGFQPTLVDKVMKDNGEQDADSLLETLLAHQALEKSAEMEEAESPSELFTSDSEFEESVDHINVDSDKKSSLLAMNFSMEEVDFAIKHLGENASLPEMIDLIIAGQISQTSGEKDLNGSVGILGKTKETALEAMFGTMDTTFRLIGMGFTEQEISSAIENLGSDVPVSELAEKILASRNRYNCVKEEEDWSEDGSNHHCWQGHTGQRCPHESIGEERHDCSSSIKIKKKSIQPDLDTYRNVQTGMMNKHGTHLPLHNGIEHCSKHRFCANEVKQEELSSAINFSDYKEMHKGKRSKYSFGYDRTSMYGSLNETRIPKTEDELCEEFGHSSTRFPTFDKPETRQSSCHLMSKPPFFFYGNVVDTSQATWKKLSQFLYGIEPEYVNTKFFSAFIRDEGYFHNLPKENRFYILPRPPTTIEHALPQTWKWWPSWDTRRQFSCISLDTAGVAHICQRLEKMLMDSQGILSKEQQIDALHQCKTLNLVWVGECKLRAIEPGQIEQVLGYPKLHTEIQGLELVDRLGMLKCCFQTDTLAYHFSVLKEIFPSGLRVLSIFSGIGGAEIAIHKLGIPLKCVVSVEASENNRRILKRWWHNTRQSGELRQIEGIEKLTSKNIKSLIQQYGGFDIVIGGSPCTCLPRGPGSSKSLGLDLNLFYEFVRVFQRLRSLSSRH